MIAIQPQYLTLAKLLDGRLFSIPEYQRTYSWSSRERNDLFSDIYKTHTKGADAGHFMAATVCLRRGKRILGTDEFQALDVVDGQQRLTTLVLLFKSISLALSRENKSEKKLALELNDLLVKPDCDELLILQTNHDSSHYFSTYLREGKAPSPNTAKTLADQELLRAIEECTNFVSQWKVENQTLLSLVTLLKNQLYFLFHAIDDEKTVYTVFEVLNSRGLDVSWIDRLKSILMGAAFELKDTTKNSVIKDLHIKWRDIYAVIGLNPAMSKESLRFAATLKAKDSPNRPLSEQDSVDLLRAIAIDAKNIRSTAAWLLDVTKACNTLAANSRINAVTRISQARLLAVAIHLRDDIDANERLMLLEKWEKISFRIYGMLGNDARRCVGDYVRLAWRIVNEKPTAKTISKDISIIGADFPIGDAVAALRSTNCYEGWERELRYVMFRYEESLAIENGQKFSNEQWQRIWMVSPSESIEHIWPQSKAPQKSKHRLGNLVLLSPGLNSKLQAIDPSDKANAYRKTGLLIAGEVADMIEEGKWNSKAIETRENKILEWAKTEWAD